MKDLTDTQVAIVGLGLMGGSLGGALRERCKAVVGIARRAESVEAALARGLIDRGTTDLEAGVGDADVVILATPVRAILRLIDELGPLLPQGCLVIDVGSTKSEIAARMLSLPGHVEPLGGHPMCGREVSGIDAADRRLYEGHIFILTPLPRTSMAALALGRELVEAIGARLLVLDPDHHDRLVATISHLPYLLACALVGTAEQAASVDTRVWDVAASGFRDTSRLAASDVTMMLDILLTNREAVLTALHTCQAQLRLLTGLVESADEPRLRTALMALRERRCSLFASSVGAGAGGTTVREWGVE